MYHDAAIRIVTRAILENSDVPSGHRKPNAANRAERGRPSPALNSGSLTGARLLASDSRIGWFRGFCGKTACEGPPDLVQCPVGLLVPDR
jgi:hypothetical protein